MQDSQSATPQCDDAPIRLRRVLYTVDKSYDEREGNFGETWFPKPSLPTVAPSTTLSLLVAISPLIQHVNAVFVFLSIFDRLESGRLHPAPLTFWSLVALVFWAGVGRLLSRRADRRPQKLKRGIRRRSKASKSDSTKVISFAILLLLLYALSPVLRTLTEATTSDTIYPLSFSLFALHICLADNTLRAPERIVNPPTTDDRAATSSTTPDHASSVQRPQESTVASTQLFPALSLNAATSASLVLASRLPSNAHVFVLLFWAILAFALYPLGSRHLAETVAPKLRPTTARFLIALAAVPCAVALTWPTPDSGAGGVKSFRIVLATNCFLAGVVPVWMRRASAAGEKVKMVGPWLVASPQLLRKTASEL